MTKGASIKTRTSEVQGEARRGDMNNGSEVINHNTCRRDLYRTASMPRDSSSSSFLDTQTATSCVETAAAKGGKS